MNGFQEFTPNGEINKLHLPVCEKNICQEITGEFSLPDYKSEIRRLLRVEVSVMPPMRYVGGNSAKFSGNINYNVLYVGSEGRLCSLALADEYEITAPLDPESATDIGQEIAAYASIVPESVVSRVVAPRKMTVRTRLCADVCAYTSRLAGEMIYGEVDAQSVERRRETTKNMTALFGVAEPFEVSGEFSLPVGEGEPELLSARADAYIDEAVSEGGACHYRGNVLLKLFLMREGSDEIIALERKLPFEDTMELDGADAGYFACAHAKCSDVRTSISEDGRILCDVTVEAEAMAQKNLDFCYTADIFSTEKENTAVFTEVDVPVALGCFNANFSHSANEELQNLNIDPSANVIDVTVDAKLDSAVLDRGRYVMSGECRYNVLFETNGEYSTQEITSPFRYEFDGGDIAPEGCFATFDVMPTRARFDGERLSLDSEIYMAARMLGKRRVRMLESAGFEGDIEKERGEITVAYPSGDESLWDVAKRYHASVSATAKKNNVIPDNYGLEGVRYLVV